MIELSEWDTKQNVLLTLSERDGLRDAGSSITVTPVAGSRDLYDLTPSSYVGALRLDKTVFIIRPKVAIDRVLFMLMYAASPKHWRDAEVPLEGTTGLIEALIFPFTRAVRNAFNRGLIQGYRTEEEALPLIRGRIRFGAQLRRHFSAPLPVELEYDDYTVDIELNRFIKAALARLGQVSVRAMASQGTLRRFDAALALVSDVRYSKSNLPGFAFTRLTAGYERAIAIARLILTNCSFEVRAGRTSAVSLLFDMNKVFEDFVTAALREALGLPEREFPQNGRGRALHLDKGTKVRLEPDMSWWPDHRCIFIGDVKYKRVNVAGILHPDLYQLLAYATATDLPSALLIYAAGEGGAVDHTICHAGISLHVRPIDVSGSPDAILNEIERLARQIRSSALPLVKMKARV